MQILLLNYTCTYDDLVPKSALHYELRSGILCLSDLIQGLSEHLPSSNDLKEFDFAHLNVFPKLVQFMNDCQDIMVGSQPLPEFLEWDGVSFWPMIADSIGRLGPMVLAIQFIEAVFELVERFKPDAILLNGTSEPIIAHLHTEFSKLCPTAFYGKPVRQASSLSLKRLALLRQHLLNTTRRCSNALARHWQRVSPPQSKQSPSSQNASLFFRRSQGPSAKLVLFCTMQADYRFHETTMKDEYFSPIHEALQDNPNFAFAAIEYPYGADLAISKRLASLNLPYPHIQFDSIPVERLSKTVNNAHTIFLAKLNQLIRDISFSSTFAYRGIRLLPAFQETLTNCFTWDLPRFVGAYTRAGAVLDQFRPDALMFSNDSCPHTRCMIIQAKKRSIPTVSLQHGVIGDDYRQHKNQVTQLNSKGITSGFVHADVTCVYSKKDHGILTERGHYASNSVVITGDWRLDRLYRMLRSDPARWPQFFGLDTSRPTATVIASGMATDALRAILSVFRALNLEWNFILKLHPRHDYADYYPITESYGIDKSRVIKDSLYESILAADLVISTSAWTTVLFDVVCLTRDFLVLDMSRGHLPIIPHLQDVLPEVARTEGDFYRVLKKYLAGDVVNNKANYESFVGYHLQTFDGKGTERVIAELERLLHGAMTQRIASADRQSLAS